ncbi:uncharacterized protein LOC108860793 [Raphanus sativus]|uniref:Uncharacterized protein LOC108860793 n=1 Tax=Raphanus sativus TaxID=3726 RepID=A0A6J0P2I8_RAPSA|nr:uncharacterized protein LOC108860793 [Raphanus sativus]
MACILSCSHGVVIATAMVFSTTALFLTISRQFSNNQTSDQQILRSCLSSEEKKKLRKKRKKVKFAEDVKEPKGNGEEYRKREHLRRIVPEGGTKPEKTSLVCRNDMPANRMALYNGILRDRDHRLQCSY